MPNGNFEKNHVDYTVTPNALTLPRADIVELPKPRPKVASEPKGYFT